MSGNDYLDLVKSMQDSTREVRRQMEELSGHDLAERLVRSTLDESAMLGHQAQLDSAAEAYLASASANAVIDQQRRLWREASSLAELAGNTARDAAALAGCSIDPASLSEIAGCRASDMAALSNDAARLARLDVNLDLALGTQSSLDALDSMRSYFEQIRSTASALRPLEMLSSSLYEQFGSTLTAHALQQELGLHSWSDPASDWQRAFKSLAGFTPDVMGYRLHDSEEEMEDAESDNEIAALDDKIQDVPRVDVFLLALRFALPTYELEVRLRSLATRVDHTAFGTALTWERMILAIASAHPQHAPELARIGIPLVQRLIWPHAPAGSSAHQTIETISMEDAEEFEMYAEAMKKVLKRIEDSISE